MLVGKRFFKLHSTLLSSGRSQVQKASPNYNSCHNPDLDLELTFRSALAPEPLAVALSCRNFDFLPQDISHSRTILCGKHESNASRELLLPFPLSSRAGEGPEYSRHGTSISIGSLPTTPISHRLEQKVSVYSMSEHLWKYIWCLPSTRVTAFHQNGKTLSRRNYSSDASVSSRSARKQDGHVGKEEMKSAPKRSELRPPKQAPSVWQIYFTDWLERKKSECDGDKKLNVAQAAKEAGQQYNKLSDEAREKLKQRALVLKANYERDSAAWKRTLTPEDITRENLFRAAQRKSGKSRRKNINDPNAPKRPMTAYFLFLQHIRANPTMVREIFKEETETTRHSVLAAAKWRSMNDAEKRPYFEQAESAKREYEAKCQAYESQKQGNEYSSVSSVMLYSTASEKLGDKSGDDGALSTSGHD